VFRTFPKSSDSAVEHDLTEHGTERLGDTVGADEERLVFHSAAVHFQYDTWGFRNTDSTARGRYTVVLDSFADNSAFPKETSDGRVENKNIVVAFAPK
jgi:hypothetical protein